MTAPTNQPDRITPAELRELFDGIHVEISELRAELSQIREGITIAAQPAPAVGTFGQMTIDTITMTTDDNGKHAYKAKGAPYQKHGVRIWPETLPLLGIDPASLKLGPNQLPKAIPAYVQMIETTDEEGNPRQTPRKVTGRA